jgi:uncharacterized NAD-dependent epimerase/dehydratase family protein
MKSDGNAIVYCEGAFNTPNGKTAHGLVRFCRRYRIVAVVDSRYAGRDAGDVLDGKIAASRWWTPSKRPCMPPNMQAPRLRIW